MTPTAEGVLLGVVIVATAGLIGSGGGAFLIHALVYSYGMSQIMVQGTSIALHLRPILAFAFWICYKAGHVKVKLALLLAIDLRLEDGPEEAGCNNCLPSCCGEALQLF